MHIICVIYIYSSRRHSDHSLVTIWNLCHQNTGKPLFKIEGLEARVSIVYIFGCQSLKLTINCQNKGCLDLRESRVRICGLLRPFYTATIEGKRLCKNYGFYREARSD